tara:strand:- start:187 stop:1038 length:852 start_codon:yes stop_codon:yes gene_type:complete
MNYEVTIVILSHKSKNLVINFINKIYEKFKIIIIDNSNDLDLKNEIEKNYSNIEFKFVINNGYGSAINYASELVNTKYFLISNPDVVGINEKNILKFLQAAKKLNDKFSSLGPRFMNADSKSHVQSDEKLNIAEMKFISGACMFFHKEKFKKLGGFDENFFLYFEESDFCLRANKIDKNYQLNNIKINHYVGSSVFIKDSKEKKELEKLRNWHFIWSKYFYYKKNYGQIFSIFFFIPTLIRIIFRIILYTLTRNGDKKEKYLTRFNGLYSSMLGKRSNKRIYN